MHKLTALNIYFDHIYGLASQVLINSCTLYQDGKLVGPEGGKQAPLDIVGFLDEERRRSGSIVCGFIHRDNIGQAVQLNIFLQNLEIFGSGLKGVHLGFLSSQAGCEQGKAAMMGTKIENSGTGSYGILEKLLRIRLVRVATRANDSNRMDIGWLGAQTDRDTAIGG